jgi:NAD-dependent dihydropyrimidine dehydrogenase PreA subunit
MLRKVVHIDEQLCDGCGECIPSCAEGAITLVNGKAKLSTDALCDGLGACLGECPRGAITVIEREADAFDEELVKRHLATYGPPPPPDTPPPPPPRPALSLVRDAAPAGGGCPGSRPMTLPRRGLAVVSDAPGSTPPRTASANSALTHWPVQLKLVPPHAPWLDGADLLVTADCVPFAYARFHEDFLAGKVLVIGCPKLDDNRLYAEKLTAILAQRDVKSVTVVRMEVPCCGGISMAARQAVAAAGREVAFRDVVIGVDGEVR